MLEQHSMVRAHLTGVLTWHKDSALDLPHCRHDGDGDGDGGHRHPRGESYRIRILVLWVVRFVEFQLLLPS